MIVLPNGNGLIYDSNLTTTNDDKTEFMLIETKQQLSKGNIEPYLLTLERLKAKLRRRAQDIFA